MGGVCSSAPTVAEDDFSPVTRWQLAYMNSVVMRRLEAVTEGVPQSTFELRNLAVTAPPQRTSLFDALIRVTHGELEDAVLRHASVAAAAPCGPLSVALAHWTARDDGVVTRSAAAAITARVTCNGVEVDTLPSWVGDGATVTARGELYICAPRNEAVLYVHAADFSCPV